jgi:hypothetical protein
MLTLSLKERGTPYCVKPNRADWRKHFAFAQGAAQ